MPKPWPDQEVFNYVSQEPIFSEKTSLTFPLLSFFKKKRGEKWVQKGVQKGIQEGVQKGSR